jgi:hypothetical protein
MAQPALSPHPASVFVDALCSGIPATDRWVPDGISMSLEPVLGEQRLAVGTEPVCSGMAVSPGRADPLWPSAR